MIKVHIEKISASGAETDSDVLASTIVAKVPQGNKASITVALASSITGNKVNLKVGEKEILRNCYIPLKTSNEVTTQDIIIGAEDVKPGESVTMDIVHAGAGYVTAMVVIGVN